MKNSIKKAFSLCLLMGLMACMDNHAVKMVKGGTLQLCPNHTVEKMVVGFMGAPNWESGTTASGTVFVNVSGDITLHEKLVRILLQFNVEGENFSFNAFEMNNVPAPNLIAFGLMKKMCSEAN